MSGFRNQRMNENLGDVSGQVFIRENIYNCEITAVKNAKFEHCSMAETKFSPKRLRDMLGVTMTLDCFTFGDLEFNELGFDTLIYLMSTTKGNDEKRKALRALLSPTNLRYFDREFNLHEQVGNRV